MAEEISKGLIALIAKDVREWYSTPEKLTLEEVIERSMMGWMRERMAELMKELE